MPFDLEAEIARRLNVSRDAIGPVLEAVIERIRQQVSHYGYARLSGLGTFRSQDGTIAFEPDPGLSEDVNLRFAGLEEVSVAAVGEGEDEAEEEEGAFDVAEGGEEETLYGESPGDDYERSDRDLTEDADIPPPSSFPADFPEAEESPDEPAEDVGDTPSGRREPFPWDEDEDDLVESDDVSGVTWAEEDDEDEEIIEATADTGDVLEDEPEEAEIDDADTWLETPEGDHPLGPVPETPFEEADYSVLDERRGAAQEDFEEEDAPLFGADLDDDHGVEDEFQDSDEYEDDDDFDDMEAGEFGAEFGDVPSEPADLESDPEGTSVAWSPMEEPSDTERFTDEEAAMAAAAGGAAFDDDDDYGEHVGHEKAPDRGALPHERIRQHPPKRHAAAQAAGGGAAGGNRSTVWIGVGVVVLVAAAAVAYFIITPTLPTEDPRLTEQAETQVPADTAATAAADASAVDTTASAALAEPAAPDVESTPLRSAEGIDASAGGFTIIVYSETSRGGAADVAERYRDDGFRTSVLEYQENGTTRYRVGVGQFSTLDEAAEARDRLAGGEVPEDAWVRRVQ